MFCPKVILSQAKRDCISSYRFHTKCLASTSFILNVHSKPPNVLKFCVYCVVVVHSFNVCRVFIIKRITRREDTTNSLCELVYEPKVLFLSFDSDLL
jgi:hypothetical protein